MKLKKRLGWVAIAGSLLLLPLEAMAADSLNKGDTAWMLTATALVLFMTIPGLALFYAGMVRSKNVLSVLMQCFAITCLMSILWYMWGFSLSFDTKGLFGIGEMKEGVTNFASFVGGGTDFYLKGLAKDTLNGSIPKSVWITFQMTFFIITPALMVGAFAERMKFHSMLIFMALWGILVYAPICHMAWAGGGSLFGNWGVLDFAGGTVVHINAGIAGLVAAIMLGKRKGYPTTMMAPHNLSFTVMGAAMLWVGWFGFNAGSAAAADGSAGMAMLVTQIATAAAALAWMLVEWIRHGKPSVLGIVTGAVAGLVAITPASGYVAPLGALIIGLSAGVICFFASTTIKRMFKYDDSLDVFGVHAVGGIVGALLTGIFGSVKFGGFEKVEPGAQFMAQLYSVGFTIIYCAVISIVLLFIIKMIFGLRVNEEQETEGLDIALHDEKGYNL
jgi:Amt family ammonium transporter